MNEARVRIGFAAYLRLVVVAILVGGFVGTLAVVGIVGAALDEIARREAPNDPYAYASGPERDEILSILVPALLGASVLLPIVCLRLRSGRRARVTWDDAGVTEWEGEAVRTFIPRAAARVTAVQKLVRRSRRGRMFTFVALAIIQISDEDGRRITIGAQSVFRALFLLGVPLWMRRRPSLARWSALEALAKVGPATAAGTPIAPDERGARRPLGLFSTLLHLGAMATGGLALLMINAQHSAAVPAGLALIAAGILLALALLRPAGEIRRLRRAGRAFAGAEEVSFRVAPDGSVTVSLADGRTVPADVGALRHPDARVFAREGTVRASLEVSAGGDAYRGAPARAVLRAVDTGAERSERRRVLAANAIELVARAIHAALVVTIGVLVVTRIQGF